MAHPGQINDQVRVVLGAIRQADEYVANNLNRALANAIQVPPTAGAHPKTPVQQALVMPVGDTCNLRCTYCYEGQRRASQPGRRMSVEDVERVLSHMLPYVHKPFLLSIHGGEPLLIGRDFFVKVIEVVDRVAGRDSVRIGMQTNGTLIDESWAEFFARHGIAVGLSLDGLRQIHDAERVRVDGTGSYDGVLNGIRLLKDAGVQFGVIGVVSSIAARQPGNATALFRHFKELGITTFDVHPAYSPTTDSRFNVDPRSYARYMIELFDRWLDEGDPDIDIVFFRHVFQGMTGRNPGVCYFSGKCTSIIGVLPDGSVIPCTRPFDASHNFGNLVHQSLPAVLASPSFLRFAALEAEGRAQTDGCEWGSLCGGGCPHERLSNGGQTIEGTHGYCTCVGDGDGGYPEIFAHIRRRVIEVLQRSSAVLKSAN